MFRIVAVACLLAGCLCQPVSARQWLDKKQGKRFEAELVRVVDGSVILLRAGRTLAIPLAEFADKDQDYIRREMENRGTPWLAASPDSLRTWTDADGHKNSAMFIRMVGRDVLLGNAKGKFQVPFELLSADDQEFLRLELTAQGKADQLPSESPEEASAKRLAKKNDDAKDKPVSKEAVGGVIGGRPFDAETAPDSDPAKKPATKSDDTEMASLPPAAKPSDASKAEPPPQDAPRNATSPQDPPFKDRSKPDQQSGDSAALLDLGVPAAPAKPAATAPVAARPAPPPVDPSIKGYPYCSRCKRANPGGKPGGPCGGCGQPLDLFQNLDGSLVELEGFGFWSQYGTMIIAGVVCVVGFIGFQGWKGNMGED